jgi:hypothetical protein
LPIASSGPILSAAVHISGHVRAWRFNPQEIRQSAVLADRHPADRVLPSLHIAFLPERRLTLDSARAVPNFFLMHRWARAPGSGSSGSTRRVSLRLPPSPKESAGQDCSVQLSTVFHEGDSGDRSFSYRTLNLGLRYAGDAHYVRVAIRQFRSEVFRGSKDPNSSKFNSVNLHPKDLALAGSDRPG